ncbi:S8 family peptidase [Ideonella alba]|nr:S8 family peptidase [Ideonella alba]
MPSRTAPLPRPALITALAGLILLGALVHESARADTRGPVREDLSSRQQDLAEAADGVVDPDAGQFTDRLIVRYRNGSPGNRRSVLSASQPTHDALHRQGLTVRRVHRGGLGAQVMTLDGLRPVSELRAVAQRLMADDPSVLYAEPDRRVFVAMTPDDPMYSQQWHYFDTVGGIRLPAAWDLATGAGVVVAVIDTGVRPHADLADNLLSGYDFVTSASMGHDGDGRDADALDPGDGCSSGHSSWHGTHVAGTIAALTNNGVGVAGVAYGAKILPVRALGCGGGYNSDIADAIAWASGGSVSGVPDNTTPARVLNLSLGGSGACSTTLQSAIDGARSRGSVVVVAAGNSNAPAGGFNPANCRGTITVAATGPGGAKAPYSNYGGVVDVAAPGGNLARGAAAGILSTLNDGGATPGNDIYQSYQGTSMATPHVAGVAALMLSRNASLTPDEVEALIKGTARGFPQACSGCGTGIVNAERAVKAVFVGAAQASDVVEVEPNQTLATAQAISSFPARVLGTVGSTTDVDHYRVAMAPGATLTARLIPNASSNYDLALRNPAGVVRLNSTRGVGLPDQFTWRNLNATTTNFYLRVLRVSGSTGVNGTYTLEVDVQ